MFGFKTDLRDLDRLPAFHAQMLQGRASQDLSRLAAAHRVSSSRAEETELVLAPGFFTADDLPGTEAPWPARALWKRGQAETEMTLYRYDLVLGVKSQEVVHPERV